MEHTKLPKEEIVKEISVFLHKHIANPEFVIIVENYEFKILRCLDEPFIDPDSIHWLDNVSAQFNGKGLIYQIDPKSRISTKQTIRFQGYAYFPEYKDGETILYKVQLNRIIQEDEQE